MSGVIVEDPMVEVRLQSRGRPAGGGGRRLGQLEEYFIEQLSVGDTFVFSGEVLRFEGLREDAAYVTRSNDPEAEIPSYNGGKFPLSTFLAQRVREMVSRAGALAHSARAGAGMAAHPGMAQRHPEARPAAGGNFSARQPALSGLLSL